MTEPQDRSGKPAETQWSMPRGLIVILGLAALVVTVAGIQVAASIVGPIFLALMLTVAVHPLPEWLYRKGVPGWLATIAAIVVVNSILLVLVLSLALSVAQLATLLPEYADDFTGLIDDAQSFLNSNGVNSTDAQTLLSQVDYGKVFGLVEGILQAMLGVFSNLLFVLALLLFMAVDGSSYGSRMSIVTQMRPDIATALTAFSAGTRKYLIVSTVFGLIVAVIDTAALWALGIPLPILWGLLSFITNYVPNVGFVLGLVPPALLALLAGGPGLMLTVIVVYSVINVIIQSVIQPKFVGDAVGLSVTFTFLSLVFWTWILGPLGAILAIPLTLMAKALLIDIDPSTRWVNTILSDAPPPPEPAASPDPPRHEKK
ncbi:MULTISPECIES: AI-2E family transporter [Rhodococcus]|uniref:AI-2E family transporter n=1 Tax=Rhodococcus oxybenzonivorans TaxID=1990687 RepID=A0AAE4V4E2_9NOCA|nr:MULTISPECIES: AI-2E family transporter [Rhodococcus]MDV7242823.1 AI-2E family transporter [Rhodococcus oxybenzonivorans]MDV7268167.1 AI-2E family transporter [Rhodococcus oxybenzonivorans]MDV7275227.1 AI-2E family transporter [Rhodococcus oxybenzonivorans]MDV7334918.1 AI-2E family transporter [Rhodococcus oxybenzonivorans]MDV7345072.1 AI-2E family transporter [Rhodococcus oxybenzonivorans]